MGIATCWDAISAARLMAPRLGPAAINTSSAPLPGRHENRAVKRRHAPKGGFVAVVASGPCVRQFVFETGQGQFAGKERQIPAEQAPRIDRLDPWLRDVANPAQDRFHHPVDRVRVFAVRPQFLNIKKDSPFFQEYAIATPVTSL